MPNGRTRVLVLLVVLSGLVLWSCTGRRIEPRGVVSAPPDTTPRAMVSTGPTPSTARVSPPGTVTPTRGEHPAVTAVRQFVRYENHALLTGDTQPLLSLSESSCMSCRAMADVVRGVYDGGGRVETGYSRTAVSLEPVSGTDPPVVRVRLRQTEQVRVSANGKVSRRIPAAQVLVEYRTKLEDGRWLVAEITAYR